MKLQEAADKLTKLAGIPFCDLFSKEQLQQIIVNKGKTGQLLELALGMKLSNLNLDFDDGELKTNKCDKTGKPLETVFITQICKVIDELVAEKPRPFEETHLFEKVNNILYVPVSKTGSPLEWMFLPAIVNIDLNNPAFFSLRATWESDYYSICSQLKTSIETSRDGYIHTANGQHIQVRSKDAKPYRPIHSSVYGRNVSNKNHAFYFQKAFVYDIQQISRRL